MISILNHFSQKHNLQTEIFVETKQPEKIQRLWKEKQLNIQQLLLQRPVATTILTETDKRLYHNIKSTDHLIWQLGDPRNVSYKANQMFRLESVLTHIFDNDMLGFIFDQHIDYLTFNQKLTDFIRTYFVKKQDCCQFLELCQQMYNNNPVAFIQKLIEVDETCENLKSMIFHYIKFDIKDKMNMQYNLILDVLCKMFTIYENPKYLDEQHNLNYKYISEILITKQNISNLFLNLKSYIEENMDESLFNEYIKEHIRSFIHDFRLDTKHKAQQILLTMDYRRTDLNWYHLHQNMCAIFLDCFFVGQFIKDNANLCFNYCSNSHVKQLKDFLVSYFDYKLPVASEKHDVLGLYIESDFDFDMMVQIE